MSTPERRLRVLVTGSGGPAAIGFTSLADDPSVEWYAADMDALASGMYAVPAGRRVLVPRGDDPALVDDLLAICARESIDVLVPTVDSELVAVAEARGRFAAAGTRVVAAPADALALCLDKLALAHVCEGRVPVPTTVLWEPGLDEDALAAHGLSFPLIAKPRRGSGSRGIRLVNGWGELADLPLDGSYLLQENLPGAEYSVDVLVSDSGRVVAAVPRTRDRVDSGVAVAGRTLTAPELSTFAATVAEVTGVRGIANVQLRRSATGVPKLLEVNPRVPGTVALSAAAGVNMPALVLAEARGCPMPDHVPHREVAMVRLLSDHVVPVEDYGVTGAVA